MKPALTWKNVNDAYDVADHVDPTAAYRLVASKAYPAEPCFRWSLYMVAKDGVKIPEGSDLRQSGREDTLIEAQVVAEQALFALIVRNMNRPQGAVLPTVNWTSDNGKTALTAFFELTPYHYLLSVDASEHSEDAIVWTVGRRNFGAAENDGTIVGAGMEGSVELAQLAATQALHAAIMSTPAPMVRIGPDPNLRRDSQPFPKFDRDPVSPEEFLQNVGDPLAPSFRSFRIAGEQLTRVGETSPGSLECVNALEEAIRMVIAGTSIAVGVLNSRLDDARKAQ